MIADISKVEAIMLLQDNHPQKLDLQESTVLMQGSHSQTLKLQ